MTKYVSILLAILLTGCEQSKKQLNVLIFPDYIDPQTVAEFEKQFDCKMAFDFYEDANIMTSKLAAGGDSSYDVVLTGHYTLPGLIQRGLLAPLRHENILNLKNLDSQFLNPKFDPANRHSVA